MRKKESINLLISNDRLGSYLRVLRERRGFSQRKVAKALGYRTGQAISNWENCKTPFPLRVAPKLAELYGVDHSDMLKALSNSATENIVSTYASSKKNVS